MDFPQLLSVQRASPLWALAVGGNWRVGLFLTWYPWSPGDHEACQI